VLQTALQLPHSPAVQQAGHIQALHIQALHIQALHIQALHIQALHIPALHMRGLHIQAQALRCIRQSHNSRYNIQGL
jgi:hypothetical protein